MATMTLSQNNNLHMIQQNCLIISSENYSSIHQHQNIQQHQQQQQQHIQSSTNKMPAIAPAPPSGTGRSNGNSSSNNTNSVLGMNGVNMQPQQQQQPIDSIRGYKKKYTYANMPYGEQPPSVARRNARERNRVKQVNNGFANLRQHIPQSVINALTNGGRGASKKLSKVDTLRLAVEYINRLQELIVDSDSDTSSNYNGSAGGSSASGSPNSQYFPASPTNNHHHNHHRLHVNAANKYSMAASLSSSASTYSETSASPTPSCSSELSIGSINHYGNNLSTPNHHLQQQPQFKYEPYDKYNSITDTTPEDEELLDYISSWQEQ